MSRKDFYEKKRRKYLKMYWEHNTGDNIFLPNGFTRYPEEVYNLFLPLVTCAGKVLDLGCGNGLLLKHLVSNSEFELVPYGVDFVDRSIEQATSIVFPGYEDNFALCNISEFGFPDSPYEFILFDPYNLYSEDINQTIEKVIAALSSEGHIIYYTYSDVLRAYNYQWVGDFLPNDTKLRMKRIDHPKVSIGVFKRL